MAVASIASMLGYDFEAVEDLRLAVDELCIACAQGTGSQSTLQLSCEWSDAGISVKCAVSPVSSERAAIDEVAQPKGLSQQDLAESILLALVDAYAIAPADNGERTGWLWKSSAPTVL